VWIPSPLRPVASWTARQAERLLGRTVDGLVFVIQDQAPLYQRWQAEKVVVHNYPRPNSFAAARPRPELPPDRFRLIYIGSLYARRGIATMLEALPRIVDQVPETLLILGGSFESEAFRQQIEAFIAAHDLDSHVDYVGWVDRAALPDYLKSADVAWLPGLPVKQYRHRAISVKQLECMLMGLPVVTSDLPHRRTLIDEANCGISVTADDPAAHAQAVLWLYRHPKERKAMGERARQLVLDRYTWETEALSLRTFYHRLLNKRRDHEPV
jgi:glycosyltransferase involved in cell wall biosynthesis